MRTPIAALFVLCMLPMAAPRAGTLAEGVQALQHDWAIAKYQTAKNSQDEVFTQLTARAEQLAAQFPERAEPKIWQAIIESTHAGVNGGLGALSKVKHARKLLEAAEQLDASALDGSIYTSLGSLYYQVPGWPLGFGDDDKAEAYLKKALTLNPEGIDPNYFYGDFLFEENRYREAATYLEKAIGAPPRPGRAVADEGRRAEARQVLAKVRKQLAENTYNDQPHR